VDKRVRATQRQRALLLRDTGLTWVEISRRLRAEWPELNARAALRIAHGWTQNRAAEEWNRHWPDQPKTDNDIGRMEHRRLGLNTMGRLAKLYQCAIVDLIDDLDDYRHTDPNTTASNPGGATGPGFSGRLTEHWDAAASVRIADLLATAEVRSGPVDDLVRRIVHQWLITPAPQTVELAAGRRIGSGLVDRLEQRVAQLRHIDDFVGGRDLRRLVEHELDLTAGVLRDAAYPDALGRRMLRAVGELCWLAGWTAADAGDGQGALAHYATGVRAAHAAGDHPGAANLISSVAYYLTNQGRLTEAVTAARSAVTGAADSCVTPTVQALLRERLAWAHANLGEVAATEAALDQVDLDYDQRDPEQDPEWIYWLDRDEIDVMAARCMAALGQPERAVETLAPIVARYDANKTRELALYTSALARAHLDAGHIDQAAAIALRVADLASSTSSSRSDDQVQSLAAGLQGHQNLPVVREFLDAARSGGNGRL
jgi:tetratricopeptide (TPR) repeat protein